MIRMEEEKEALRIQKENEERHKLFHAEKEKLMGETSKQQQQSIHSTPSIPAYYPTPLYPVDEVPALKPTAENKVISAASAG